MSRLLKNAAAVAVIVGASAFLLDDTGVVVIGDRLPVVGSSSVGSLPLSPAQVARYAREAGFSGDALVVAVAVALAESGGDPQAHNAVPPDDSYGLWHVNMLGALGPERRRQHNLASNRELFDPAVNARVAHAMSDGGRDWSPWATYTSGAYRRHLDQAQRAAQS